jgi:outer membrane protein OmpU
MKKLLLASTALVATAGFAAADVSLSGSAEMGVKKSNFVDDAEFHTDIGVTFSLTGESDGGIAFGGSIDLEDTAGIDTDFTGDDSADYTVFISAGGATLTMGDTDGAFDAALTEVDIGGALADDHTVHAGFSGNGGPVDFVDTVAGAPPVYLDGGITGPATQDNNFDADAGDILLVDAVEPEDVQLGLGMGLDGLYDGQTARFDYVFGDFGAHVSAEIDDTGEEEPIWGLGFTYGVELAGLDLALGLGHQTLTDFGSVTGVSVATTFTNGIQAIVNYSQFQEDDGPLPDHSHAAIGLGYTMNALTIGVNYGVYTVLEDSAALGLDSGDELSSGFGLAANYDLGGGLSAQFGYGSSSYNDDLGLNDDETDSFSLGLAMSF